MDSTEYTALIFKQIVIAREAVYVALARSSEKVTFKQVPLTFAIVPVHGSSNPLG